MDEVKPTKPRPLSKKQKGFIKDYIATGNGTQAALNNYDVQNSKLPAKTASVIAAENLAKPSIRNAILSIAEQIPDEVLVRVHNEGLKANYGVISQGQVIGEAPDHAVRHKYLDSAYKLKGSYAPERSVDVNVSLTVDPKDLSLAEQLLDQRREKRGSETSSPKSDGIISQPLV